MGLFINPVLLPLFFLAAAPERPLNERYPQAIEVFSCKFDQASDANFDGWPDGWTRRRGPGYPSYVKIKIQPVAAQADDAAPNVRQCLKVDLDGGGAAVFSPPVEVGSTYSYVLEGSIRTEQLQQDRAFLSVTFLDADKHPLVAFESEATSRTRGWKKITLGPIAPPSRETKLAVIGLHVEPGGAGDLTGSIGFAEIRLVRLPRLELKTNQAHNLFLTPAKVEVSCTASGFAQGDCEIVFKLFDALGEWVADDTRKLGDASGEAGNTTHDLAAEPAAAKECAISWEPPIPGPGFYRVRAELRRGRGAPMSRCCLSGS